MNKNRKPKVWLYIAVILVCCVMYLFLIFETDAIYDVDISNFDNTNNLLRRPISAKEIMIQVERQDGSGDASNGLSVTIGGNGGTNSQPTGQPQGTIPQGTQPGTPPAEASPGDSSVEADIRNGTYTKEDLDYMVALAKEASDYEGFYAVACSVRNRCKARNKSVKFIVTEGGQYTGFDPSKVGDYSNTAVYNAAVAVLRGGPSTIGDYQHFFGRSTGNYDIWYEADKCGSNTPIVVGSGAYRNVFYSEFGSVHNEVHQLTSDAVILYKYGVGWLV